MLNKQREKRGSVLHFSPKQYNEGQPRFLMNTRRMEWEAWNPCKIKAFAHVNTLHLFLQTLPPAATNPFTRVDVNEYPARCERFAGQAHYL